MVVPPPTFTLSPAAHADIPAIASAYLSAFRGSGFDHWWSPSADAMRAWAEERLAGGLGDPLERAFKVVASDLDGDSEEGLGGRRVVVVAFAKWNLPARMRGMRFPGEEGDRVGVGAGAADGKGRGNVGEDGSADAPTGFSAAEKKSRQKPPEGSDVRAYADLFGGVKKLAEKWDARDKLGVGVLCTDPAYSGRGLGSALLEGMLDVADKEGVTAYVEAMRRAAPLYERHGFVTVDSVEFDTAGRGAEGKLVIDIMIREP